MHRRKYLLIVSAEKKNYEKKFFNFSSKTKIRINFLELFDLKTPQTLLHSSFVPHKKQNLSLFLQKFDRYDFIPLRKEVPCSNVKTKFMKSSSFRQVFGLFFVAIVTLDQEIVFQHILLNLSLKTKYTVKLLFERHGVRFFNLFFKSGVELEDGALFFDYLVNSLEK